MAALPRAGINVGLGTDGAASNNRLDILERDAHGGAARQGRQRRRRASLGAHEALRMATLDGARALGLEARIGSIVPGKRADLAAVELSALGDPPLLRSRSRISSTPPAAST